MPKMAGMVPSTGMVRTRKLGTICITHESLSVPVCPARPAQNARSWHEDKAGDTPGKATMDTWLSQSSFSRPPAPSRVAHLIHRMHSSSSKAQQLMAETHSQIYGMST